MRIVYTRDDLSTRHIVLFRQETLCGKYAGHATEAGPALPATCDECRMQNGKVIRARRKAPQSGYTPCACRDCMDITMSSDVSKPELCSECKDAGCGVHNGPEPTVHHPGTECQRDDAYGEC